MLEALVIRGFLLFWVCYLPHAYPNANPKNSFDRLPMFISTQVNGAVATIRLEGRFTFNEHRDFRQAIKDQLDGKCSALEIDFGKVEYMDSAALGMLLLAKEGAVASGKTVSLVNCRGAVQQVLEVANFQKLFTIR